MGRKTHKVWLIAGSVALLIAMAAVIGLGGCAAGSESVSTTAASMTAGATQSASRDSYKDTPPGEMAFGEEGVGYSSDAVSAEPVSQLTSLQGASGQKVISDAQVEVEVKSGGFETAFAQALLIADRYGGYIVSSSSHASGEDEGLKSGVIAIRVPSTSFDNALADAAKLGEVKNRQIQTQDVTGEYVDLEARITNARAHVQAVLALMAKAKTVDEILQVQQVLTQAQGELEQLEGRKRYLDEHTSFSTVAITMYESGAVVTPPSEWGITKAMKDALHNLVEAFNAIIRGLGVLIPVLIVLAIIGYVAYRIWKTAARRRREREAARYQPHPQGWPGQQVPGQQVAGQQVPLQNPPDQSGPNDPGAGPRG